MSGQAGENQGAKGRDRHAGRDRRLDAALWSVAGAAAVLSAGSMLALGLRSGLSAAAGGAVAVVNFWLIVRLAGAFLQGRRRSPAWGALGALKLAALLGVAYAIVRARAADPLGFILGYAALPLGIVLMQLPSALRPSPAGFDEPPRFGDRP